MKKMELFVSFPCFLLELWSLHCPYIFCIFVLTSARNLNLLKQFTCRNLKGLVAHFYKMVLFIMVQLTVIEILEFEVKEVCQFSAESSFFWYFNCYYLMNGGSDLYKPYHFLKERNENFQINICKLLY